MSAVHIYGEKPLTMQTLFTMRDKEIEMREWAKSKIHVTMPNEERALRYNKGKLRWSLVDYEALIPLVRVLMYGAKKYTVGEVVGDHNWKKGLDKTEILESMQRHLISLLEGEEIDPESGEMHIGHVLANAMFYSHFTVKDARQKRELTKKEENPSRVSDPNVGI